MIILWCSGRKKSVLCHDLFIFFLHLFLSGGSLWQPCSQYQSTEYYSISTLNTRALYLNIRTAVPGLLHYCLLTFPVFHVSQPSCLLVLQRVNVLTLTPEAPHFIQESLIAPESALCLLYAPKITYSSALEQTYAPFEAFGPRYYGTVVIVHL